MTTPPYQPGPYGQPDPYGQQPGGGYGQYGPRPGDQPQYGGQWDNDRTERFGPSQPQYGPYGQQQYTPEQPPYGLAQPWPGAGSPYGQPPEPPRKKNTGMIVTFVVVAVLVVAGGGIGIYFATKGKGDNTASGSTTSASQTSDPSTDEGSATQESTEETPTEDPGEATDAQPGDCIKVNVASSTNADIETVDCATPEAVYKVGTREEDSAGDCPNDQYVQYTEEGQLMLCLQLNVRDGECLEVSVTEDKRADCASPAATHKVVGVFDVDDETQCPDTASEVITYPQPALTICLGSPTAT